MKWHIIFILLIIIANLHIFIDFGGDSSFLGFPAWLFFYVLVHVGYAVFMYRFSQTIKEETL